MKKVTKIVALFVAVGTIAAVAPTLMRSVHGTEVNADSHAITIDNHFEDGIGVIVTDSASAGEKVEVRLAYSHDAYEVHDVWYNEEKAARVDDSHFYFYMPDEDVVVSIGADYENQYAFEEHSITNASADEGIVFVGLPEVAVSGNEVYFHPELTLDTKLAIKDIEVTTDEENPQKVSLMHMNDMYWFVMPKADVVVSAITEGLGYVVTFEGMNGAKGSDNIQKMEIFSEGHTSPLSYFDEKAFAKGGDIVTFYLKNTSKLRGLGVKVNDEMHNVDEDGVAKFVMPSENTTVTIVTEIIYWKLNIDTTDSKTANYTYKLFTSPTSSGTFTEREAFEAYYGEYIRVYATPKDGVETKVKMAHSYYGAGTYDYESYDSVSSDERGTYLQSSMGRGSDHVIRITEEYVPFTIDMSFTTEKITAKLVNKVGDDWVENTSKKVYEKDYVYVQFTIADPEVSIDSPKVVRTSSSYGNIDLVVFDEANNVYKTKSGLSNYTDYKVTWSELKAIFKGYDFIGSYKGANIYNSGKDKNKFVSDSYSPSVTEVGTIKKSTTNYVYTADGDNTHKTGTSTILVNGKTILLNKHWFVSHYSFSSNYNSASDYMIGYKPEVTDGYVKFHYSYQTKYIAISALNADNVVYGNMFIVRGSPSTVYLDCTFNFDQEYSSVADSNAAYDVVVNGDTIGRVSDNTTWTPAV